MHDLEEKKSKAIVAEKVKKSEKSPEEKARILAARSKLLKEITERTFVLDVEAQAEVQAQAQVQSDVQTEKPKDDPEIPADENIYSRDDFFQHPRIKKTIDQKIQSKEEWLAWWDNLFGNIANSKQSIHKNRANPIANRMTGSVLDKVLKNPVLFSAGMFTTPGNFHVHGFRLGKNEEDEGWCVYFDEAFAHSPIRLYEYAFRLHENSAPASAPILSEKSEQKQKIDFSRYDQPHAQTWWQLFHAQHLDSAKKLAQPVTPEQQQELKRCFHSFLQILKQEGLKLPELAKTSLCLKHASSMPVALGRILSLISNPNLSSQEERQAQLNLIPQLSLASIGAIRALSDYQCRFVSPEMQCEAPHFSAKFRYRVPFLKISRDQEDYHQISEEYQQKRTVNYEKAKQTFWRYIAYQEKGMPLQFYIEKNGAIDQIENSNLNEACKVYLYECLASISSRFFLDEKPDELSKKWKQFITFFSSLNSPIAFPVLKQINKLMVLPPIDLLEKIIQLTTRAFPNQLNTITSAFDRLNNVFAQLARFNINPEIVYQGMRFCLQNESKFIPDDADISKSDFFKHLDRLASILGAFGGHRFVGHSRNSSLNRYFLEFLIKNYDVFQLDEVNIRDVLKKLDEVFKFNTPLAPEISTQYRDLSLNPFLSLFDHVVFNPKTTSSKLLLDCLDQLKPIYEDWDAKEKAKLAEFKEAQEKETQLVLLKTFWTGIRDSKEGQKKRLNFDPSVQEMRTVLKQIKKDLKPQSSSPSMASLQTSFALSYLNFYQDQLKPLKRSQISRDQWLQNFIDLLSTYPGEKCLSDLLKITKLEKQEKEAAIPPSQKEECDYVITYIDSLLSKSVESKESNATSDQKYSFNDLFEPEFLKKKRVDYCRSSIPEYLIQLINHNFSNPTDQYHIQSICAIHYKKYGFVELFRLMKKLKNISAIYSNPLQASEFLYQWHIYETTNHQKHSFEQLEKLLNQVISSKAPHLLESLLYQPDLHKIDVVNRGIALYSDIFPWLLKNTRRIPEKLSYPTLISILLSVPKTEFDAGISNSKPEEGKEQDERKLESPEDDKYSSEKSDTDKKYGPLSSAEDPRVFEEKKPGTKTKSYSDYLIQCYERIYTTVENSRYSLDKKSEDGKSDRGKSGFTQDFLKFMSLAAQEKPPQGIQFSDRLDQQLTLIEEAVLYLNRRQLRHLFYHYSQTETYPSQLMEMLSCIRNSTCNDKKSLYSLLSKLVGEKDKEGQNLLTLDALKTISSQPELLTFIKTYYKKPPYLSLQTAIDAWKSNPKESKEGKTDISNKIVDHDKEPFKRDPNNEILELNLKAQAEKFGSKILNPNDIAIFLKAIQDYRKMETTREKIETLDNLKKILKNQRESKEEVSKELLIQLTAILGELLYASTGKALNHTQYLVLLNNIIADSHITHKVATGEGKSRILMALCAAQCLLGKSVDFVTSSLELAERDFYSFASFFKVCGVRTQLIQIDTEVEEYCQGDNPPGVNFSSPQQLNLFLDKAHLPQKGIPDFKWDPKQRLILDEADFVYFDLEEHAFNYAIPIDKRLGNVNWIYPHVMEFISNADFDQQYEQDYETVLLNFKAHLKQCAGENQEEQIQISKITEDDIEMWLSAGLIANSLEAEEEFEIELDQLSYTPEGMRQVSLALFKRKNHIERDSRISDAVHQCLYARLNLTRQSQFAKITDNEEFVKRYGKTPFYPYPENRAIRTMTASLWTRLYDRIYGMTGSEGSEEEIRALKEKFPTMQVVKVPPHKISQLKVSSSYIAGNEAQQIEVLIRKAKQAIAQNRPVLIVCKNDFQAKKILEEFKKQGVGSQHMQRVWANMPKTDYADALKQAGQAGKITFTTSRFARGTDIELAKGVDETGGLYVLGTYLPRTRDEIQMFGRAGRQGQKGQARLVLNQQEIPSLQIDHYVFEDVDHYLAACQAKFEYDASKVRYLHEFKNYCCDSLQKNFFERFGADENKREEWANFLKTQRANWRTLWSLLQGDLRKDLSQDEKKRNQISENIHQFIQERYQAYQEIFKEKISLPQDYEARIVQLKKKLTESFTPPPWKLKPQPKWESAHTGKQVIYSQRFAERRGIWRKIKKAQSWTDLWKHIKDFIFPSRLLDRAKKEGRVLKNIPLKRKSSSLWWIPLELLFTPKAFAERLSARSEMRIACQILSPLLWIGMAMAFPPLLAGFGISSTIDMFSLLNLEVVGVSVSGLQAVLGITLLTLNILWQNSVLPRLTLEDPVKKQLDAPKNKPENADTYTKLRLMQNPNQSTKQEIERDTKQNPKQGADSEAKHTHTQSLENKELPRSPSHSSSALQTTMEQAPVSERISKLLVDTKESKFPDAERKVVDQGNEQSPRHTPAQSLENKELPRSPSPFPETKSQLPVVMDGREFSEEGAHSSVGLSSHSHFFSSPISSAAQISMGQAQQLLKIEPEPLNSVQSTADKLLESEPTPPIRDFAGEEADMDGSELENETPFHRHEINT